MKQGRWWSKEGARFRCELCPRRCLVSSGQRGFCFVRQGTEEGITLTTYGRSSGFCVDPIEKKPLHHFLPGTSVLSFGTAGCNMGCTFCQNWDISKAKEMDRVQDDASPEAIASAALQAGCRSAAFTYNDPTIFAEYAIDCARACRDVGVHPVAVTNGWIEPDARRELYAAMDAANIDLKAFTEDFYKRVCYASLAPVKDTLRYVVHDTKCHVEITTLLIPGHNDDEKELHALATFVAEELSPDVPLHFSAFHPDYKMQDVPPTPPATLRNARRIAREHGLKYVYTGNVHDEDGGSTRCASCGEVVVGRDWYELTKWNVKSGACGSCGAPIAGVFEDRPGSWGRRRMPLRILAA